MSYHIENVIKAIEFNKPDYLPMETNYVPGIYNAYSTLDPEKVELIPGTEEFDAIWPISYSWVLKEIGKNEKGESIRSDQFGNIIRIPNNLNVTYDFIKPALKDVKNIDEYKFPDINNLDNHFKKLKNVIKNNYSDRFINCFIDAGFYLTTYFMIGPTDIFIKLATEISFVLEVYERVVNYYKGMVKKYKQSGAHMITVIEDIGTSTGLIFNPNIWVKEFKPILKDFFSFVHEQGLYTSLCIDGNSESIHEHLKDLNIDVFFTPDIETTGIEKIKQNLKGKICLKAPVDMISVLPCKSPEEVEKFAVKLVNELNNKNGGFICEVVKWYRPEFPMENILASVKGFNRFRRNIINLKHNQS